MDKVKSRKQLEQVRPSYIHQVWPWVAPLLARPFASQGDDYYSLDQLKVLLVSGEHVLFVVADDNGAVGAFTVCIQQYPNKRVAFISALGGRGVVTEEVFAQLQAWAVSNGCTDIQGNVRDSVARLMEQQLGMKRKHTVMEFKL